MRTRSQLEALVSPKNITVANNTIIGTVEGAPIKNWGAPVNGKNIRFHNNSIYQTGDNPLTALSFTDPSQVTANNNYWSRTPENSFMRGANDIISSDSPVVDASFIPTAGSTDVSAFMLRPNSLAINAGANLSSLGFNTDYFGPPRQQGSAWDIGAHEFGGGTTIVPVDINRDGTVNIFDYSAMVSSIGSRSNTFFRQMLSLFGK